MDSEKSNLKLREVIVGKMWEDQGVPIFSFVTAILNLFLSSAYFLHFIAFKILFITFIDFS